MSGVRNATQKSAAAVIILSIAIATLGGSHTIEVNTALIDLSLPKVYVVLAASFVWYEILLASITGIQLMTMQIQLRLLVDSNPRFLLTDSLFRGNKEVDLTSPFRKGHLFDLCGVGFSLIAAIFSAPILVSLVLVAGSILLLAREAISSILEPGTAFLAIPGAFGSLIILVSPIVYLPLFFLPVRIKKNKQQIRWNFLSRADNLIYQKHPQIRKWTSDS
jgi:hypothetical protein